MFGSNKLPYNLPEVKGKYLRNVPLNKHTWFGVGGPAEVMFFPKDTDDLSFFLKNKLYNLPVMVIGGGSNLLVRDGGIPGVVIKLDAPAFKKIDIREGEITCGAGTKNATLKTVFIENGLGGLEFLCSIPGCLGGSIRTNAGCFGKSIKDVLLSIEIIDGQGRQDKISPKDLNLSYRSSSFPDNWIITALTLKTEKTDPEAIKKTLEEHKEYRVKNQPYNQKTAGSTFKNPEGLRAWELIKNAGCAEMRVGGAKVSEKHANFIVNDGNATAKDIETLGETIIKKVREKTSIALEWEIKRLGIE